MTDLLDAILHDDAATLAERLTHERAADIAETLDRLAPAQAAAVVVLLPLDIAIDALDQPGLDRVDEILTVLPAEKANALIEGMSADRVADVFRFMSEPPREALLDFLPPATRATIDALLAYPEESAGSIMTTEFVAVPSSWTIAETLDHVRMVERSRETIYSVYVTEGEGGQLVQAVTLRRLISGDPAASVMTAAPDRRLVTLSPHDARDEAMRLISKYDLLALPVVDARGLLIGIVTVDDVIDAIVEAQTDAVQRFGGSEALGEPYLRIGFWAMIKKRGGWLSVLFLSEMLTASAMQGFESELEKAIVLTLFIPLIMSSGGNSGSQATSLLIRALALRELTLRDWWRVALREIPTGLTLGAILGLIGIVRITVWQETGLYNYGVHWPLIALTVGTALVGIVTFGSLAGSMLPFALRRLGFDPASASAPFVATLVDVTGLIIYFGVAAVILHGTLL